MYDDNRVIVPVGQPAGQAPLNQLIKTVNRCYQMGKAQLAATGYKRRIMRFTK